MALPTAYLTSIKNVPGILDAIKRAQAPPRFTQKFLEGLGYPSSADRLMINVLKALRFLNDTGEPQGRYHQYLDQSQSKRILGDGIRQAYADLFQVNANANEMPRAEVKNKMKTLSQGQHSDAVLDKMASTFKVLSERAQFVPSSDPPVKVNGTDQIARDVVPGPDSTPERRTYDRVGIDGLVYSINIHLPESRDPAVYDALFRSLREHLL